MLVRRIACRTLWGLALLSCRAPNTGIPRTDPVALVSPETGPSPLQGRLAAMPPASAGKGEARLDAAIDAFHARTLGRRGYLAVDKPLYQPGETVWFRAFDLASADLSGGERDVATVKLISPRGSVVAEKKLLVDDGAAGNDFVLAADLPGGEYILRAESERGMKTERRVIVASYESPRIKKKLEFVRKAYGPGDTVAATVALHRATGEPLANKAVVGLATLDGGELARVPVATDAEGNATVRITLPATIQKGDGLLTVLVEDGGVTESVQKRIPITIADLALSIYPEGGDLIAGLPGRVYFAAKDALDKPADIEGRVVDDRGELVALLRSYHDGLGRFELHPEAGRTYHVEVTRPTGIARRFELPAARATGCAIQAIDDFASQRPELRVAVWCTSAQDIVASAVLRERRVATATAAVPRGEPAILALPVPAGTQGAVRVTVFDRGLAPLAERLIYRSRGKDLAITIQPDKTTYTPREAVALAVETRDPDGKPVAADLAVSVVDDTVLAFADDKQATLLARLYLEAELPGAKIEEPNFYFGADPKAPAGLDLVLGTHGWRRFLWKAVLDGPPVPPPPPITDPWAFDGELRRKPGKKVAQAGKPAKPAEVPADELDREEVLVLAQRDVKPAAPAPKQDVAKRPEKAAKKANVADDEDDALIARKAGKGKKAIKEEEEDKPVMHMRVAGEKHIAPEPVRPATIEVVGAAPVIDATATRQGITIDRDYIRNIPAPGRTFEAVLGGAAGEAIEIRGEQFDRHGFEVGGEGRHRGRRIRDAKAGVAQDAENERPYQPELDPFCCVEVEREFPAPTYAARYDGPRTDFRETLLWKSRVRTDATGKARLSLYLSDAVTSFKVAAEGVGGGRLGRGEAQLQSKKPVSLAVKLPLEVSSGDHLRLPVTVANETVFPYVATLEAKFGKAFTVAAGAGRLELTLAPHERRSMFYDLDVVGDGKLAGDGKVAIAVGAASLRDEVERTISVVPIGFPQEVSMAGTLSGTARHEVFVGDVMPGTMRGKVQFYPSPLATMVKGTEAMIAEPGGCFEQASSTNYPNIMILGYLEESGAAAPELVARTNQVLERGYKLLTGYETTDRGYEWFGSSPGHEALTAYGLMEFRDMSKVYASVDKSMVDRTRTWLRGRRDGKGGYRTSEKAIDTFGRASADVTDAYITYALAQSGDRDLEPEIAKQRQAAMSTKDPYLMALAAQVLVDTRPKDAATRDAVRRLAGMQAPDGGFPGADHSITRSGGDSLAMETTALAALVMIAAGTEFTPNVRKAVEWLNGKRDGGGRFGSTQATVLSLKAMAAYAKDSRRTEAAGVITLVVNGARVARIPYDKGQRGAIELELGEHLRQGKNVVELTLESKEPLPYSGNITWGSRVPASNPATKVRLATQLAMSTVKLGEGVRMNVQVSNATAGGVPMTLARVGLPGGLTFQTWQLKELRDKKLIDFYETRPREVILYFRDLAPNAVRDIPLELMSTVPGTFVAPASRVYLYYTDEHKHWVAPSVVTVTP